MTNRSNPNHRLMISATIAGGAALSALLVVAAPGAGQAHAHGYSTPSGDAVGRPGLDNPAPGVRLAQAVGDHIYNQKTPLNKAFDDSPAGQNYHAMFGAPDYETPTHGSNGTFTGVLNMPGALKDGYNAAQASGRGLPEEEDLPGTGIRAVSGAPVPAPHETTGGSSHSSQAAAATPAKCAVLATRTALRAQGLC
jgi:hypothetical protein